MPLSTDRAGAAHQRDDACRLERRRPRRRTRPAGLRARRRPRRSEHPSGRRTGATRGTGSRPRVSSPLRYLLLHIKQEQLTDPVTQEGREGTHRPLNHSGGRRRFALAAALLFASRSRRARPDRRQRVVCRCSIPPSFSRGGGTADTRHRAARARHKPCWAPPRVVCHRPAHELALARPASSAYLRGSGGARTEIRGSRILYTAADVGAKAAGLWRWSAAQCQATAPGRPRSGRGRGGRVVDAELRRRRLPPAAPCTAPAARRGSTGHRRLGDARPTTTTPYEHEHAAAGRRERRAVARCPRPRPRGAAEVVVARDALRAAAVLVHRQQPVAGERAQRRRVRHVRVQHRGRARAERDVERAVDVERGRLEARAVAAQHGAVAADLEQVIGRARFPRRAVPDHEERRAVVGRPRRGEVVAHALVEPEARGRAYAERGPRAAPRRRRPAPDPPRASGCRDPWRARAR